MATLMYSPEFNAEKFHRPLASEPTFDLPTSSGVFLKGMIHAKPVERVMWVCDPPPYYNTIRSSTADERVVMYLVAHAIAHGYEAKPRALFYCTQLAGRCMESEHKALITNPSTSLTGKLGLIYKFIRKPSCQNERTEDELASLYPLDTLYQAVLACTRGTISTQSVYISMHATYGCLSFPWDKAETSDDVRVPVVLVEPFKILPPRPGIVTGDYESQLCAIIGDVLVAPFDSRIMTISFAQNCALDHASARGVNYVRFIVTWDVATNCVVALRCVRD